MQELYNWQDDEGISMSMALFATPYACRSKDERQMLFDGSCSLCLRPIWSFVWGIGTAGMTKQVSRSSGQCLKVCVDISAATCDLLLADVETQFQARTRTPDDVLRHTGSPFAPDKEKDATQLQTHVA